MEDPVTVQGPQGNRRSTRCHTRGRGGRSKHADPPPPPPGQDRGFSNVPVAAKAALGLGPPKNTPRDTEYSEIAPAASDNEGEKQKAGAAKHGL